MSEIIKEENRIIIKPGKDIVASTADGFRSELLSLIKESPMEIVIDLSGVKMVDSVGIGVIIATHNSLNKNGGSLRVTNIAEDIYNLFTVMRLDHHFKMERA